MSLIKNLNGYDECKRMRAIPGASSFRYRDIEFTREELERAMLEYRRENNIFEVGDEVIILTNAIGNKYIWRVKSIDGCMIELTQIGNINEWLHVSEITHTTDANTKNGVRL